MYAERRWVGGYRDGNGNNAIYKVRYEPASQPQQLMLYAVYYTYDISFIRSLVIIHRVVAASWVSIIPHERTMIYTGRH
jgi:hypothetical protein